jgi:hypothetical protein
MSTSRKEKVLTRIKSKNNVRMVVSYYDTEYGRLYAVYTADEWAYGKGLRSPEFEDCILDEARSQAENF